MSGAKPKIYLETTVPSYFAARPSADLVLAGHQHVTRMWWESHRGNYDCYVSELVIQEASRGDVDAAQRRLAAIAEYPVLRVTAETLELAAVSLRQLPLPKTAEADALHVALATVHQMEYLATWNCRHIARGSVIRALPGVNAALGFESPTICTLEELLYDR